VEARSRGNRVVECTADVILEAWGPDLAVCCEEAVAALTATCVDARRANVVQNRRVCLAPDRPDALLIDVLDEVIFTLDTADGVPIAAEVCRSADGGLDMDLAIADRETVVGVGAVPKAISRSGLRVESRAGKVWCRFLVDV
jgi:SHS2 domain-containing protein